MNFFFTSILVLLYFNLFAQETETKWRPYTAMTKTTDLFYSGNSYYQSANSICYLNNNYAIVSIQYKPAGDFGNGKYGIGRVNNKSEIIWEHEISYEPMAISVSDDKLIVFADNDNTIKAITYEQLSFKKIAENIIYKPDDNYKKNKWLVVDTAGKPLFFS